MEVDLRLIVKKLSVKRVPYQVLYSENVSQELIDNAVEGFVFVLVTESGSVSCYKVVDTIVSQGYLWNTHKKEVILESMIEDTKLSQESIDSYTRVMEQLSIRLSELRKYTQITEVVHNTFVKTETSSGKFIITKAEPVPEPKTVEDEPSAVPTGAEPKTSSSEAAPPFHQQEGLIDELKNFKFSKLKTREQSDKINSKYVRHLQFK